MPYTTDPQTIPPGLLDSHNSLMYRVAEIERHMHSNERWASKLAIPAGGRVTEAGLTPFQVASGAGAYGVALQVMDVSDAEGLWPGAVYYDMHRILVADVGHTTVYRFRFSWGGATAAASVLAGDYCTTMFRASASSRASPIAMQMRRVLAASRMWVEVWNATNLSTVDFFIGMHFYEG